MKTHILTLILSLFLTACGKRAGLEFLENEELELKLDSLVTFEDLKQRILLPHCVSCHKRSDTPEGIEKWVVAGDPENSKIYQVIREGRMPKKADPLSSADLEYVRQYIVDLVKVRRLKIVDFNTLKNEVLTPHCLSCHRKMDNEESINSWINTKDPMSSRLLLVVQEGKMPKNAPPLSQREQDMITQYLNNFLIKDN